MSIFHPLCPEKAREEQIAIRLRECAFVAINDLIARNLDHEGVSEVQDCDLYTALQEVVDAYGLKEHADRIWGNLKEDYLHYYDHAGWAIEHDRDSMVFIFRPKAGRTV